MNATYDTTKVRINSSTRTVNGRQYRQHCVRWYEADGKRRQKCFGARADAVAFKKSVEELPPSAGRVVTMTLQRDLLARLDAAAKRAGCTPTELVQAVIRDHVDGIRAKGNAAK